MLLRLRRKYESTVRATEGTAICPFSDFPDLALIRLEYVPNDRCIELKSLKPYINSFRQVKIFHEHVTNLILEDFVRACDPLRVAPGGSAVTPDGDFVYVVSASTNTVVVIGTASNTVVATVPVGTAPKQSPSLRMGLLHMCRMLAPTRLQLLAQPLTQ